MFNSLPRSSGRTRTKARRRPRPPFSSFAHKGEQLTFLDITRENGLQHGAVGVTDLDTVPGWFLDQLDVLNEPKLQDRLNTTGGVLNTIDGDDEYAEVVAHVAWVLWAVAESRGWLSEPNGLMARVTLVTAFSQVLLAVREEAWYLVRSSRRGSDILVLWREYFPPQHGLEWPNCTSGRNPPNSLANQKRREAEAEAEAEMAQARERAEMAQARERAERARRRARASEAEEEAERAKDMQRQRDAAAADWERRQKERRQQERWADWERARQQQQPAAPPKPVSSNNKYPLNGRDDTWSNEQLDNLWKALTKNNPEKQYVEMRRMALALNDDSELLAALGFREHKINETGDDGPRNRDYLARLKQAAQGYDQPNADTFPKRISKDMLRSLLQGGQSGQPRGNSLRTVPIAALAVVRLADWLDTFHVEGA